MDSFLVYCSICCFLVLSTDGVTLTLEMKSSLPLKGSRLELSCNILEPFISNNKIVVWKGSSEVTKCFADSYLCEFYKTGYSFTTNRTGAFGSISSLTTEAEGTWRCSYRAFAGEDIASSNTWNLIVYTIPPGLSITQSPNQDVDLSVDSVVLQCKTTGCTYPMPTVQWIFKDQTTSSDLDYITNNPTGMQETCAAQEKNYTSTLNLSMYTTLNDNSDKTGTFSCRITYPDSARNIIASASHTVRFAVNVSNITLEPPGNSITFLDGTNKILRCNAGPSRPQPVIRWWLDVNEVTNFSITTITGTSTLFIASSELHLVVDKTRQGKKVYCDAKAIGQAYVIESVKPVINVWYQPSLPSVQAFQGNFPWLENQTGTLQCVMADYGNPKASVIWPSFRGTSDMNSNLVFRNLSSDDHGQPVYCQAQNNFTDIKGLTVVSPTIRLNVEYRPIITLKPSVQELRIKEGSNLTITCMASGNPLPIVQWKNRNPTSNTLLFPGILRNSTGAYTCVASSTSTNYNRVLLQREESVIVIVEYSPDVRVSISGYTEIGSTAVLMCVPKGEPPQYTFHPWIHMVGQTEIRRLNGVNTVNNSTHTLSNISIQDMGTYKCTVDNSITGLDGQINQMGDIRVYVQGPPVIGVTDSTFTGEADKSAMIEIPIYSNSSIKTVKFIKHLDSVEISNTSNVSSYISPSDIKLTFYTEQVMIPGHVAVLFFKNVTDTDFDSYTLQLFNENGNVTMVFAFIASGPPSAPKTFFYSHIDAGFLVFGIEKGFDGGHDQTFIVEYQPFGMPEVKWSTILKINETDLDSPSRNKIYYIKIPKIQDGQYIFRVYAANVIGNSSATEGVHVNIKGEQFSENLPVAAITGGIIGPAIFVIVIVVVALIVKRRTQLPKTKAFEGKEMDSTSGKQQVSELEKNPMYVSSVPVPVVQEYAAGVEPERIFGQTEDPRIIYAQVDKSNVNKGKKAPKEKPVKTSRAAPKGKPVKTSKEDVYENSPLPLKSSRENVYENPGHVAADLSSNESVYENPESSASKGHLVNKDGLLYVDVILGPPSTRAGKPFIHGLEDRTVYADIAYDRKGEPLPESDEEKESSGARKNGLKGYDDDLSC